MIYVIKVKGQDIDILFSFELINRYNLRGSILVWTFFLSFLNFLTDCLLKRHFKEAFKSSCTPCCVGVFCVGAESRINYFIPLWSHCKDKSWAIGIENWLMAIVQLPQAKSRILSPVALHLEFRAKKITGLQSEYLTNKRHICGQFINAVLFQRVYFFCKLKPPFLCYCIEMLSVLDLN